MPLPPIHRRRIRQGRRVRSCQECLARIESHLAEFGEQSGHLASALSHQVNRLLEAPNPREEERPGSDLLKGLMQLSLEAARLHQGIQALIQPSILGAPTPLDLAQLVRESLRLLQRSARPDHGIVTRLSSGIWVTGLAVNLQQAILSVAQNALQAMEGSAGTLTVVLEDIRLEEGEARELDLKPGIYAELTLQDDGPGMEPDVRSRIFEPFFTTAPQERKGLGLPRARATLLQHAGALVLTHGEGPGSAFRFLLPCTLPRALEPSTTQEATLHGTESILFVDRDPLTRDLAQWGLEALGYHLTAFENPTEALQAFRSHPNTFDAVVFDLVLPRMGGMDLAHRLRHLRKDIPLVLMTDLHLDAHTLLGTHTELKAVLPKPFTVPELAACLRRHLPPPAAAPAPVTAPREIPRQRSSILLAEDSAVTRGMLRACLLQADFRVLEARDGQAAWEAYQQAAPEAPFDLLLTDVVMPRMDGLELARRIREVDPSLPIAVMTTVEDREIMKSAILIGVNDFLSKPFDQQTLLECVRRLLSNTGQRAEARRSVETAHAVRMAQRALLAVPEKDLPLYSLYEPLTDAGGDVFRAFRLSDGRIFFLLGDVAGHSVISSYAVASFLGMLSTFNDSSTDLATLAHRLNQGIQDGPFSEVPVCTLLGIWHPDTGRVQLLNAGIPHGALYRASTGTAESIRLNGTPLGILPDPPMDETVLNLHPGDRLLFGTDGFFEVQSSDRSIFEDKVLQQWSLLKDSPVQWALSLICEAARAHGEGVLSDDLLVLGFEQGPLKAADSEWIQEFQSNASEIDHVIFEFKGFLESSEAGREYSAERRFEIVLVLREALTNAVFHGNQSRAGARITFHARFLGGGTRLLLRIADEGSGFPLDQHQAPTDPASERGRGIPLMRHFAQSVEMTGSELNLTFDPEGPGHDQPISDFQS